MADAAKPDATSSSGGVNLDVDIEKDSVAAADEPPGLAAVYAGKACAAAADDISDKLINATNGRAFEVLIVSGGSILADSELGTSLRFEMAAFRDRLEAAEVETRAVRVGPHVAGLQMAKVGHRDLLAPAVVAPFVSAALKALPAGVGLLSKLIAHQYTTSSAIMDHPALGLDLRVAGSIRAKLGVSENAHVHVERFWQPPNSDLIDVLTNLAHAQRQLASKVAQTAALAHEKKSALDDATAAKTAGRAQLLELSKTAAADKAPAEKNCWSTAWDYAKSLAETDLTVIARTHGEAVANLGELQELHNDLEAFVASTVAAPSGGGASTLARAMRAEWLAADAARVVLYVGPLAAGLDQVLETKLGPDRRVVLAGTSVEYAAVGADLKVMFAGVIDNLWGGTMNLDKLADFSSKLIDYVPVPNATRREPV